MLHDGNIRYIKNLMYVPGIKNNLISVSMMADQDLQVKFFRSYCVIKENKKEPVSSRVSVGSLYRLNVKRMPRQALASTGLTSENLWHQRFGHLNLNDLPLL